MRLAQRACGPVGPAKGARSTIVGARTAYLPNRSVAAPRRAPGAAAGGTPRSGAPLAPHLASPKRAHLAAAPRAQAEATQDLALYTVDPDLRPFSGHLDYRWAQYEAAKKEIEETAGSLEEFAKGYQTYGFSREGGATVYREWAPGAQAAALIGDFSGWQPVWMQKGDYGVWSVTLPDGPDGPAIPHGSRVKVRLQSHAGWWVDRVPAWARFATVPPNEMGAKYDGVYWDPPEGERHAWQHPRPPKPASLRIYEAHVGMAGEGEKVSSYRDFITDVIPRIKAQGYTAIQLMAIQEHAYYASFGYHVTNPFAVSSRSGSPEDLKALVDAAHGAGLLVLLDVVHSHISKNADDGLAGFDLGQAESDSYFRAGPAGYHSLWDSRVMAYGNYEVKRYLLSNLRYWLEEYRFDGFRFDGVTSMLYQHHGIGVGFSGNYNEYFGPQVDVEACVYLMLANELVHKLLPEVVSVAEDVSGMPGLARPVSEGGLGFDYRLAMAVPDKWIQLLKHVRDEHWPVLDIVTALCNRRYSEKTVAYAESHDQALVGDKTIAMWLMDAEMYTGMSALSEASPVVDRGIAMHKMIRAVTMALGGEAFLNFMGNEFGHPEWLDFPRDGNNWSYKFCRRQWSLADADHLRYRHLLEWDRALNELDDATNFMNDPWQWCTHIDQDRQVLVAERGPLVWVFNWSPHQNHEGLEVAVPEPGRWRPVLSSDDPAFGGRGRVGLGVDHFTSPASEAPPDSLRDGRFHDRDQFMRVLAPPRTAVAYRRAPEEPPAAAAAAEEAAEEVGKGAAAAAPKAAAAAAAPAPAEVGAKEGSKAAAGAATAAEGDGAPPKAAAAPAAAKGAAAATTPAAAAAAEGAQAAPAAAAAPKRAAAGSPAGARPGSPAARLSKVVDSGEWVMFSFDEGDAAEDDGVER